MRRWILPVVLLSASCGGSPVAGPSVQEYFARTPAPAGASPAVVEMFHHLDAMILNAIAENAANLPRNPGTANLYAAKNEMMRQPGFAAAISANAQYVEGAASSLNGRHIPVVAIFAQPHMRTDATSAVRELERAFTVLEAFLATDYPQDRVWIWYGFVMGARGGGGQLFVEDRATYESRTSPDRLPYDAILAHEHAHSYISNEALTQFLELYAYNLLRTGSRDVQAWPFTRAYVAFSSSNVNVSSLLDVYQWIGADRMSSGYQAVLPLRPPYGSPLSDAVKQAFAATVPEALRAEVHGKLSTITF